MVNSKILIESKVDIKCKLYLMCNDDIVDTFYYYGGNILNINYNYINHFTKGKPINIKIENLNEENIKIISKENNIWRTTLDVCRIN